MEKLRVFRGEGAFVRAEAAAKVEGLRLCGTYVDKAPAYFLAAPDATDADVQALAFRIREGREMGDAEHVFVAAVQRHLARQSA